MQRSTKILLGCLLLYAVCDFLFNWFVYDYTIGHTIFNTAFSTAFIAFLSFYLSPKLLKRAAEKLEKSLPKLDLLPNEEIVLAAPANHWNGIESVGGKLTLTDRRLVFRSHKFNFQNHREEFDRASIASAVPHSKLVKGIVLTTQENVGHTFIVDFREKWISELNSSLN